MASSLKYRLLLVLFLAVLPVVILVGYGLRNEYLAAVAEARSGLVTTVAALAQSQQSVFTGLRDVMQGLLDRKAADDANGPQCSAELARFQAAATGILNAGITDGDGAVLCSAVPLPAATLDLSDRDWFRDALAHPGLAAGTYQIGRITGQPILPVAVAGRTPQGALRVAFLALDLGRFQEMLGGNMRLPQDVELFVADHGGTVIAHAPEPGGWPGRSLLDRPLGRALMGSAEPSEEVEDGGVRRLVAAQPVTVDGRPVLLLAILKPLAAVTAAPLRHLFLDLAILLAASFLNLALAWSVAERFLARPIGRIAGAAARVAAGERGVRVGPLGHATEIAGLGASFDAMASALEARTAALDGTIRNLREANETLSAVIRASPAAILCLDRETRVTLWNPAAERLFGWPAGEVIGRPTPVVPDSERDHFDTHFRRTLGGESVMGARGVRRHKDGTSIEVTINSAPLQDETGQPTGALYVVTDLTLQMRTERELQQARKMEAVGQLTGGIAHDFNNLLGIAMGNLELLQERLGHDPAALECVQAALDASMRGAELTRQLLAFARRQPLRSEAIDPVSTVRTMTQLLGSTLGEAVALRLRAADGTWRILADSTQLQTAILNLAVNARDAMPGGGTLTIEIANAVLEEDYARAHSDVAAGDYVEIAVSDTGTGMPPDVVARAFDPFFTTKGAGRGTGLGLSMVYGFIKQSAGDVKIYSEPGRGTTVKLWLPRAEGESSAHSPAVAADASPRGSEMILVVEDNDGIRRVVVRQLKELGYRIVEAGDGPTALRVLVENDAIVLLFTDIIMPGGMDGRALAREATALRPRLKVLFTSGFTPHGGDSTPLPAPLLSKPYRKRELAEALRQVLGGGDR